MSCYMYYNFLDQHNYICIPVTINYIISVKVDKTFLSVA